MAERRVGAAGDPCGAARLGRGAVDAVPAAHCVHARDRLHDTHPPRPDREPRAACARVQVGVARVCAIAKSR
eukprot:365193-Chlamydomonas_euryale.AAC.8